MTNTRLLGQRLYRVDKVRKTMKKTSTARPIMMPISMGILVKKLGMGSPFGLLGEINFDGVGADDADAGDLGSGVKSLPRGDGLVFDSAIELADVHLED